MSRPETFSERYPDSARSGSSSNLIAGELIEARRLIPDWPDLRESEAVLERREQLHNPPWTVRGHWREHHTTYVTWGGFAAMMHGLCVWMGVPLLEPWWSAVLLVYMLVGGTLSGV